MRRYSLFILLIISSLNLLYSQSNIALHNKIDGSINPSTKIKFQIPLSRGLPAKTSVQAGVPEGRGVSTRLIIYDLLGQEVATLVNENLSPGTYEVEWPAPSGDASNYPGGVYFYKLNISNPELGSGSNIYYTETKRMILLK